MERLQGWGWDRECAVDSGRCYQKTRPRLGDRGQGQQGGQRQLCGTLMYVSGGREGGTNIMAWVKSCQTCGRLQSKEGTEWSQTERGQSVRCPDWEWASGVERDLRQRVSGSRAGAWGAGGTGSGRGGDASGGGLLLGMWRCPEKGAGWDDGLGTIVQNMVEGTHVLAWEREDPGAQSSHLQ